LLVPDTGEKSLAFIIEELPLNKKLFIPEAGTQMFIFKSTVVSLKYFTCLEPVHSIEGNRVPPNSFPKPVN